MSTSDRILPDWIEGFMKYTDNSEPPRLFRKWTAISCVAAALQRKVFINWGTALTFYPNLYVVLVGPSATGKGTAMGPGLEILQEVTNIRLSAQATSLQALIRHLKNTNLTDIDIETGKQIFHSSLTIFSKEFTVFLGYQNKELMSALCDWYDCDRKWTYDTISRDKEEITGVWVNLIAGTTPDLIQSSFSAEMVGGGLTSRIIFVFEEKRDKLIAIPVQTPSEHELFYHLVHDLEQISHLSGEFKYTEAFSDAWVDWVIAAENDPPFHDRKFDGYNGRRRGHLMKLAMIISASHGRHDLVLDKNDLDTAIEILNEVEVKMGLTFRGVGVSDTSTLVNEATRFILTSHTKEIPVWLFARHFQSDMDKYMMDRVLATLEVANVIDLVTIPGQGRLIRVKEE